MQHIPNKKELAGWQKMGQATLKLIELAVVLGLFIGGIVLVRQSETLTGGFAFIGWCLAWWFGWKWYRESIGSKKPG